MDSDRIAGDRTDVWSGFEMDGWENDLLVDQIEDSLLGIRQDPILKSDKGNPSGISTLGHPASGLFCDLETDEQIAHDPIKVLSSTHCLPPNKAEKVTFIDAQGAHKGLKKEKKKGVSGSKSERPSTTKPVSANRQESILEVVGNKTRTSLVVTSAKTNARDQMKPATGKKSAVKRSTTANMHQLHPVVVGNCLAKPPKPATPVHNMCHMRSRGFAPQNSTLRQIPQEDGLVPLKPWPTLDYGISGEEYLSLFHQRSGQLDALQPGKGCRPMMPLEGKDLYADERIMMGISDGRKHGLGLVNSSLPRKKQGYKNISIQNNICLAHRDHQMPKQTPSVLDRILEPGLNSARQREQEKTTYDYLMNNFGLPDKQPASSGDQEDWVSQIADPIAGDDQVLRQNGTYMPKSDEADNSVVFFNNSSFEPVDPPWKSERGAGVGMQIEELPFPYDPNFTIDCFAELDEDPQFKDVPTQDQSSDTHEDGLYSNLMDLEPDEGDSKANKDSGERGRKRSLNEEHGRCANFVPGTSTGQQSSHKNKGRRSCNKRKDGKPRIYPRVPKITSLLPACVNNGLLRTMLKDLQSHVKDYINDPEAVDRVVQDLVSYLALLQRLQRNNQNTDWCEGCIELVLSGLHNSRIDPVEARESGLLNSIQRIASMENVRLYHAANIALKEDWAVEALMIEDQQPSWEPPMGPMKKKQRKNVQ